MADYQHSISAPCPKPNTINALARRVFLGGAAIVAVSTGAIDCFAAPIFSAPAAVSRVAWDAALADVARTKAAFTPIYEALNQAESRYYALQPERPTGEYLLSLKPDSFEDGDLDKWKARVKVVQDDYDRQAELARRQSGLVEAEAAEDLYSSRIGDAVNALMLCPAPDLAAVVYKIELAKTEDMDLHNLNPVLVDLRRLGAAA
jgi:hypothetical protein